MSGDKTSIHLVYGTDDNYWLPTAVSAASAAHGTSYPLVIHLFDAGVNDGNYAKYEYLVKRANHKVKCVRHILDKAMFTGFGDWRGSLVTYSRMFMSELLPDLDWAIYFDGDTLWTGDIAKLWNLRDETMLIQASIDPPTPAGVLRADTQWYEARGMHLDPKDYLCMGLMLANLRKMREENIAQKCRDFMSRFPAPELVDQTVLNYVCKGATAPLPPQWGVFSAWHGTADLTQDGAIHYVNDVPWRRDKINRLMSDVVLLWYEFGVRVLDDDYLPRYVGWWGRLWRRWAFLLLKKNQWILSLHPYLKSHLRNTHGLTQEEWQAIIERMAHNAK